MYICVLNILDLDLFIFVQEQFNSYRDDHSIFEQCLRSTGELLMLDHGAIFLLIVMELKMLLPHGMVKTPCLLISYRGGTLPLSTIRKYIGDDHSP